MHLLKQLDNKQQQILKIHLIHELQGLVHKEQNNGKTFKISIFSKTEDGKRFTKEIPYTINYTKRDHIRKRCLMNNLKNMLVNIN